MIYSTLVANPSQMWFQSVVISFVVTIQREDRGGGNHVVHIHFQVIYNIPPPPLSGKWFLFNLSLTIINIDDTEWYWEILLACLCARGSGLMASLWDQSIALLILEQFSYFSQQGHIIMSVDFDNNWYFSSTRINRWQC